MLLIGLLITGALDQLTQLLLERETVDGTDLDEILGRVPGRQESIGATSHQPHEPPTKGEMM